MSDLSLIDQYIQYCTYLHDFNQNGKIDLSSLDFVYPTTMLPLSNLIISNIGDYISPDNYSVSNYVDTMIGGTGSGTYVPLVNLPKDISKREEALQMVYRLQKNDKTLFGGEDAFKYVVQELTDNIYEHSSFNNATIMGQKYQSKGYVDLCFYDDGISIPTSLANKGLKFQPFTAIAEAINGLSTKDDGRGYGLRTSIKLFLEGLHGEILVISGAGGVYFKGTERTLYDLSNLNTLQGTLISLRVPLSSSKINIYDYVK